VRLTVAALQVEAEVGKPRVNYLEAITQRVTFDYLHKKQSGGLPLLIFMFFFGSNTCRSKLCCWAGFKQNQCPAK
jgi:hypothetical protein